MPGGGVVSTEMVSWVAAVLLLPAVSVKVPEAMSRVMVPVVLGSGVRVAV